MNWLNDISWQPLGLLIVAAVVHASYQASLNVMTMLAGHLLGAGHSNRKLLNVASGYILGTLVATFFGLASLVYFVSVIQPASYVSSTMLWLMIALVTFITGVIAMTLYFKPGPGTSLQWIPHGFATYLQRRSKLTGQSVEAFSLGVMTVIAQLPFTLAPLLLAATILYYSEQLQWFIALYIAIVMFPLLYLLGALGGGMKVSAVQQWREDNKKFLQFITGIGLLLLGFMIVISFGPWGHGL